MIISSCYYPWDKSVMRLKSYFRLFFWNKKLLKTRTLISFDCIFLFITVTRCQQSECISEFCDQELLNGSCIARGKDFNFHFGIMDRNISFILKYLKFFQTISIFLTENANETEMLLVTCIHADYLFHYCLPLTKENKTHISSNEKW